MYFPSSTFPWDEFRVATETRCDAFIADIKHFLEKGTHHTLSTDFYYSVFFPDVAKVMFEEFLVRENIKHREIAQQTERRGLRAHLSRSMEAFFEPAEPAIDIPSEFPEVASIRFWHRHENFEEAARPVTQAIEIKPIAEPIHPSERFWRSVSEIIHEHFRIRLTTNHPLVAKATNFKRFSAYAAARLPRVILTNAHGLYPRIDWTYLIAWSRERGSKIIVNQPGLIHSVAKYFHQVEYEKRISTRYLAWSDNNLNVPNSVSHGCYYRHRLKSGYLDPRTLVVLPQIPARFQPISSYWGFPARQDESLLRWIVGQAEKINNKQSNIVLRCKSSDFTLYKDLFGKHSPKLVEYLNGGDVNSPGQEYGHFDTIVNMYFSTSIVESAEKSNKTLCLFPVDMTKFHSGIGEEFFNIQGSVASDADDLNFDYDPNRDLTNFINKNSKHVTPDNAANKLTSLLYGN